MIKSITEYPKLEGTHMGQSPAPGPAVEPQQPHWVPESIYPLCHDFYLLK